MGEFAEKVAETFRKAISFGYSLDGNFEEAVMQFSNDTVAAVVKAVKGMKSLSESDIGIAVCSQAITMSPEALAEYRLVAEAERTAIVSFLEGRTKEGSDDRSVDEGQ